MKKVVANPDQALNEAIRVAKLFVKAESNHNALSQKMTEEIEKVKEKYQIRILEHENERINCMVFLEQYAIENPSIFSAKSTDIGPVTLGYRTGNWKVNLVTEAKEVIEKLKKYLPGAVKYKEEINKAALIADRNNIQKEIVKCGIEIVQDEYFYVQPN